MSVPLAALALIVALPLVAAQCPSNPNEYYFWTDNVAECKAQGVQNDVTFAALCATMRKYTLENALLCSSPAASDQFSNASDPSPPRKVCNPSNCFACLCCGALQVRGANAQEVFRALLRSDCWGDNFDEGGVKVGNVTLERWLQSEGYPQATCLDRFFCNASYGYGVPKSSAVSNSKVWARSVSVSSDGSMALMGMQVYNATTLQPLRIDFGGSHAGGLLGFGWTDEGEVFTYSNDATMRIWDVATGRTVRFVGEIAQGWSAPSGDGKLFVLKFEYSPTGQLLLWNVTTGRLIGKITVPMVGIFSVSYNGSRIAAIVENNDLEIVDLKSGQRLLIESKLLPSMAQATAWSPTRDWFATLITNHTNSSVAIVDAVLGKIVADLKGTKWPFEWSSDGERLATACKDGGGLDGVCVWDASSWTLEREFKLNEKSMRSLSWTPTQDALVISAQNQPLRMLDLSTGGVKNMTDIAVGQVQWSRDGSKFVSMCGNFVSPLLCVFDGATFEPLTNFSIASWDDGWKEAHFSPAAGEATVGWIGFRSFGIFDAAANAPVCKGDVQEPLAKMLISPSGDRMAVISQYTFSIIDTRTCELVRYMRLNLTALNLTHASFAHPFPIEWSSDGYFAAVLPRNNEPKTTYVLFLLDADSGALIRSIPLQSNAVAIAPAPLSVGAFVAVGTSTTQILQVDASATDSASVLSNNASWTLPDMRACGVMAWSPNGKFFAAAFRTTVRLFDVLTMRHIATLAELDIFHFIEALSWFPDSIHIATAASASGLRVWDLRRFADMSFFSNATAASNASAEGVEGMEATSNVGSDLKAGGAKRVVEEGFADGYARGGGVENESREESEGEGEDENGLNGGGVGEEDNEGGSENAENMSRG